MNRISFFRLAIFLPVLFLATAIHAADAPLPPEIEDEQTFNLNKEAPHATLMPYADLAEALAADRGKSSFARSLNGDWRFHWVPRPEERPVDFYRPDYDVSGWKTIPVPSCWQLQGYGTPQYTNVTYPFKNDPPHVMGEPPRDWTAYAERNPVGSYRRDFEVPAEWRDRRVFLTFDGVDSNLYLWINGERVGYSTNSRAPAEFDVTKYLRPGKNVLAAEVYRFCAGAYLEDQDMWRLSGIFRNVTLWSAPTVHIRDFSVVTELDAQSRDATLRVMAKVKNYGDSPASARSLYYALYDPKKPDPPSGRIVSGTNHMVPVPALAAGAEAVVSLAIPIADPRKWTAETPELYTSVLGLFPGNAPDGADAEETLSSRTGFRQVDIKDGVFRINGVPVKLLGFNRHENEPDTGHTVSEESMVRDIKLLKGCNSNHVRTCHYQDDPRWYELCDEYGLYLVAEANLETHGTTYDRDKSLSYKPSWEKAHLQRQIDNVESNKNHASVVVWSLGNEAGGGPNFAAAAKTVRALDVTRPVHYEGDSEVADMQSRMYASPEDSGRWIAGHQGQRPFYLCEYAHAMNNSLGGLWEYLEMIDQNPQAMGGAIWEWQDQALWNRRDPAQPFLAYGGGFGEKPNDGVFILKGGGVFADRTPNPKYFAVKHGYQWIKTAPRDLARGGLTVHNKYAFTPLSRFRADWTLTRDGVRVAGGELTLPEVAPGASAPLDVPLPSDLTQKPGEYFLHVGYRFKQTPLWCEPEAEVATDQFCLPVHAEAPRPARRGTNAVQVKEEGDSIVVADGGPTAGGFRAVFSRARGALVELVYRGETMLTPDGGGLALYAYRAPHRDDDRWAASAWKAAGLDRLVFRPAAVEVTPPAGDDGIAQIRVSGTAEGKGGFSLCAIVNYTVDREGGIEARASVLPQGARRLALPRIGMRVLLNPALDQLTYFARGPQENYPDRQLGAEIGIYASAVRDQFTPYVRPMECGNHGDARWCALRRGVKGAGLRVDFARSGPGAPQTAHDLGSKDEFAFSALPYTDEELEKADYARDLPPLGAATVLTLAARTLGVGSGSCGPAPFAPYRIYNEPLAFAFRISPVAAGATVAAPASGSSSLPPLLVQRDEAGQVSFGKIAPGAFVSYALGDGEFQPYTAPFAAPDRARLHVQATRDGMTPFAGEFALPKVSPRNSWKITASSFQRGEGDPEHAIDGDPGSFWHSRYTPPAAGPHFLVIDTGRIGLWSGLVYTGRDNMENGRARDYEVYFSNDGEHWGEPTARGRLRNDNSEQRITWPTAVAARYVKFMAVSEVNGHDFASVAELDLVPTD